MNKHLMTKISIRWERLINLKNSKNPEKNTAAKLGYTATMVVVSVAILICMKKYKDKD